MSVFVPRAIYKPTKLKWTYLLGLETWGTPKVWMWGF